MPVNIPVLSFNSGELSPQIDARSDVQKYSSGCRTLENFIPRVYGSAERRPGTKYIGDAKNADLLAKMVPFIYSDTIAYMCEFGEDYIRFFYNGARVVGSTSPTAWADTTVYIMGQFVTYATDIYRCLVAHTSSSGSGDGAGGEPDSNFTDWIVADLTDDLEPICETPTPYQEGDLLELQIRQIADTMWIIHKNYQPRKLTRTSITTFDLSIITIDDGPFKKRNDLANNDDITLKPSGQVNYTTEDAKDYANKSVSGTASVVSGSGTASGAIGNINDGDYTTYYRRTATNTRLVIGSLYLATAYFTAKVTLNNPTTIEKIKYALDWDSDTPTKFTERTVTCSVEQGGAWTSIATSTDTEHETFGSWAAVTAIRIYVYATSGLAETATIKITLNELEAWGVASITTTPENTTGAGETSAITLTASSALFNSSHIGSLFKITQARENTYVTGSSDGTDVGAFTDRLNVKGEFSFSTTGVWDKVVELQRNVNNEGWEVYRTFVSKSDARLNTDKTYTEDENNVKYRAYVKSATSGTIIATIKVHNPTQDGIARVVGFTSSTLVTAVVLTPFASVDASYRWYEGAWSNDEGWPSAFAFFEERAIYAGSTGSPQTIWLSASGDYEKFDEGTNPDSAFWLTMGSDKRNSIRWLSSLEALCIGTNGGEWRLRAKSLDEQLTWENFDLRQQTAYGSKKIQPLAVGSAVLFVDTVGRKIREMTYVDAKQKFVAPDLAALAEHITLGGITSMAFQKNPDLILWCTLAGGGLRCMVYERDQNVIAWAKFPLGGTSAVVDSVGIIPAANEDEIWMCVVRTVDGDPVRHIVQAQPRVDVDLENAWFVDDGLNWDGGDAITITGISDTGLCVITAPAHGLSNGDNVYLSGIVGTTELNGGYYTVANVTTNTFSIQIFEQASASVSASASPS